jgi:hypothetical protein
MGLSPRTLRPANNFTPRSISGLALWLDGADSGTTYTTDAGPVTPVTLPTDISGCAIWLDGDQSVTTSVFDATSGGNAVAAGGTIARWQDKSGNGRHFVQAGSTLQPTLTASGRNGRSVVTFDATNDCMTSAATQNIAQPATWIFVYKTPSSVASGWALVDSSVDRVHVYSASGSDLRMYTAGGSIVLESSVVADTWRIGTYHFNGASSQGRSNGVQSAAGTTGTVAVNGTIYLASNGGATTFRGQMAEAILLTNASLADIARVESYLAAKWGITGVHAPATATSDPVGYWGDKSGNARHATQSTAGNRPVIHSATQNNRKILSFDGSNDSLLGTGAQALKTGMTVIGAYFSGNVNYSSLFCVGDNANGKRWLSGSSQGKVGIDYFTNSGSVSASAFYRTGITSFTLNPSANSLGIRIDGAQVLSQASLSPALAAYTSDTFAVGTTPLANEQFLAGRIFELAVYNRVLSAAECRRVEQALATKWGLTLAPTVSNADAQDWVNRVYANGGTVSASTAAAVSAFCDAIDYGVSGASIRDRFYRLNLFCGGTSGTAVGLNSALVPLYRGQSLSGTQYGGTIDTNNGPFLPADYSEASGLGPQATSSTSKYLDTGFAGTSFGATRHVGVFIPAPGYTASNAHSYLGSSGAGGINHVGILIQDNGICAIDSSGGSYNSVSTTYLLTAGHYVGNTPSGAFSLRRTWRNGVAIGNGGDSAATPAASTMYVFAENRNGTVARRTANGMYGYHFGLDMTSTQAESLRSAFNTFATAIGRPNL